MHRLLAQRARARIEHHWMSGTESPDHGLDGS